MHGEVFKLSSEFKHSGLLFQLDGQLKQFAPSLPVSTAHKTLAFRLEQEDFEFPNLPVSSDHQKRPNHEAPAGLAIHTLECHHASAPLDRTRVRRALGRWADGPRGHGPRANPADSKPLGKY